MPARLIYTNYPQGNYEWKFMVLISNNDYHRLEYPHGFNFIITSNPVPLHLQAFEQSFIEQGSGIVFKRLLVADYSLCQSFAAMKQLAHSSCIYFELGSLTNFVGVNPVNYAPITSPLVSRLGLDLKIGKYQQSEYQSYFTAILAPYAAWYELQAMAYASWLRHQEPPPAVVAAPKSEPQTPLSRSRRSSFSGASSVSSTDLSDYNLDDYVHNSAGIFFSGLKKVKAVVVSSVDQQFTHMVQQRPLVAVANNTFASLGLDSGSEDSADEVELAPAPVVVITASIPSPKNKANKRKGRKIISARNRKWLASAKKLEFVVADTPIVEPTALIFSGTKDDAQAVVVNDKKAPVAHLGFSKKIQDILQAVRPDDERIFGAARVLLVYFIAYRQDFDLLGFQSDPAKYFQKIAVFMAECFLAGAFFEMATSALPRRKAQAPRLW